MSNNKQQTSINRYNQIWAVAILRDDYGLTWRSIGERLNIENKKAAYLYGQRKKHYSLNLGAFTPSGERTIKTVSYFSRSIGEDTISRERHPKQG